MEPIVRIEQGNVGVGDARPAQVFHDALQRGVAVLPPRRQQQHQRQRGQPHHEADDRTPVTAWSCTIHGGAPRFHHHLSPENYRGM